jgi:Tol biopolymer transport system component
LYTKFTAISKDGRYVTFDSDATNLVGNDMNGAVDVFRRDTINNTTTRESVKPNGSDGECGSCSSPDSQIVDVSPDGRYILFKSMVKNLTTSEDSNGSRDGFVRDTLKRTTTIVTVDNSGHI